ncbi:recombinase family protein [Priestia aryabhattai]|uniref:recombinase family protein n=1 Tax=Priestia aryabhattai TaxID=412384 RepID=UPI003C851A9D
MKQIEPKEYVAIYVRKSRDDKGDIQETLHNQKMSLINLADNKSYDYDLYQEVESSVDFHRPELNNMINNIKKSKYSRILVTHIDRLSRDERDSAELKEIFISYDILIETPDNIIDLTDENQELMYGFNAVLSAYEYRRIRQRLLKGKLDAVAIGNRWVGSVPPLGYDWDKNKKQLVVNKESSTVKKMIELALAGYSSNQIAFKLNDLGYRTKTGKPFKSDRILRTLKNRVYLGEAKFNYKRMKKSAIAIGCHEPLITEEQYNLIQNLIQSRKSKGSLASLGIKSCLNKILVCGVCGKGLTIQKNKRVSKVDERDLSFYHIRPCLHKVDVNVKCPNRGMKIKKVEDAVQQSLKMYKQELQQTLKQLLDKDITAIEHQIKNNIDSLKKDLVLQQSKNQKLLDLYLASSELTLENYQEKKAEIDYIIDNLEKEITINNNKLSKINISTQINHIENIISMLDNFKHLELEEQNATLKLIITKVVFTKTAETNFEPQIDIHWREL